jgi:hypothetical protein
MRRGSIFPIKRGLLLKLLRMADMGKLRQERLIPGLLKNAATRRSIVSRRVRRNP